MLFYHFFYFLEDIGLLNVYDPCDLFALHFTMLPVIQHQLDPFRDGWANHSLRTEQNRTPLQLWIMGLLNCNSSNVELSGLPNEVSNQLYNLQPV